MSTDTDVVLEKCQAKLRLAKQLDREAEGYGEKKKDAQKRADALRAEVERLIVDPTQTEMPLDPSPHTSDELEEWKDAETTLTEAAEAEAGGPVEEAAAELEPV